MFFQSYKPEDFGPEAKVSIPGFIKKLLNEFSDDRRRVVESLESAGYEVSFGSHGYVTVSNGKESCEYPLGASPNEVND